MLKALKRRAESERTDPPKRPNLSLLIEENKDSIVDSDNDSLFDEPEMARRTAPPIPGMYLLSSLLPESLTDSIMQSCMQTWFNEDHPTTNQIMLFGASGLPPFLNTFIETLATSLQPHLPPETHALLFESTNARQAILNLYHPGEGISPHVDLLDRFGDGILGVSFGSGCVMRFVRVAQDSLKSTSSLDESYGVYLPERSVIVLSGDARYSWTHGIEKREEDWVEKEDCSEEGEWIRRGVRMSITFRWLLPGADVVGWS